jgi:glycerophosphoryl diester phosphodiesterase
VGILSIYLLLVIVGGGLGDKEPLPDRLAQMSRPILFIHRGVTGEFPENSVGAIDQTLRCGFQALEIDLQFSADSQFFLFHDFATNRLTGVDTVASELTIDELQQCPLRSGNGESTERIPTLADIVERYGDDFLFYFDMKRHGHHNVLDLADDIAGFIEEHDLFERVMVASAHFGFITYLEYNHPRVMTVLEGIDPRVPWLISWLPRKFRTDFIASRHATVTDGFLTWLEESGMTERYIAYHVDETRLAASPEWEFEMLMIDHEHSESGICKPEHRPKAVDSVGNKP